MKSKLVSGCKNFQRVSTLNSLRSSHTNWRNEVSLIFEKSLIIFLKLIILLKGVKNGKY